MNLRRRLALWLCRAAGLTELAVRREEIDDLRDSNRKLTAAYAAQIALVQTMAQQLNTNTLMMRRWLEASPALQTVERAHATRPKNGKRPSIILPPSADLRAIMPGDWRGR